MTAGCPGLQGLLLALGALAWLASYQIGLARNLRYLTLRRWERVSDEELEAAPAA